MPRPKRAPEHAGVHTSIRPRAFVIRAVHLYIERNPTSAIRDLTNFVDYAICQMLEDVGQGSLLKEAADQLRAEAANESAVMQHARAHAPRATRAAGKPAPGVRAQKPSAKK